MMRPILVLLVARLYGAISVSYTHLDVYKRQAVHYIETQMIELALKKGNIDQAKTMIARTAPVLSLIHI